MRKEVPLRRIREEIVSFYTQYGRLPRLSVSEQCGGDSITVTISEKLYRIPIEISPELRELEVFYGTVVLE